MLHCLPTHPSPSSKHTSTNRVIDSRRSYMWKNFRHISISFSFLNDNSLDLRFGYNFRFILTRTFLFSPGINLYAWFLPQIGTVCFTWWTFSLSPCSSASDGSKADISALLTQFSTADFGHDRLCLDPMDLTVCKEKELICTFKNYRNCIYFL